MQETQNQKAPRTPNKTITLNPPNWEYKRRLEIYAMQLGYSTLTDYFLTVNKPENVIPISQLKEIDELIEKEKEVIGYE